MLRKNLVKLTSHGTGQRPYYWTIKTIELSWNGGLNNRWNSSGTIATELGVLGTDANGITAAGAYAVNDAGTSVNTPRRYQHH